MCKERQERTRTSVLVACKAGILMRANMNPAPCLEATGDVLAKNMVLMSSFRDKLDSQVVRADDIT